jgi:hypothetical protein
VRGAEDAAPLRGAISTVHDYRLPLAREEVWELISQVSNYREWWPWLRVFEGSALAEGQDWRCEVQPPVPYPVRFGVTIERVEPPALVRALVHGDVVGDAELTLEKVAAVATAGAGCLATLRSSLAPGNRALQMVSRFAGPIARFGHDWVLDSGARQFIARAVAPVAGD